MNEIEKGQLTKSTIQCYSGLVGDIKSFPGLLKRIIEEKAWERRTVNGRTYKLENLRQLITEKPLKGWGKDPEEIRKLLNKLNPEVEAMYREAMKGQGKRTDLDNNVMEVPKAKVKQGNSRAYLAERLKRDHPEIFERFQSGEFKSARAAAIEAGIIKVKTPMEKILALLPKLSEDEWEQLRAEIAK